MSSDASDGDHGNDAPEAAGRTHDPASVPLDVDEGADVVIEQENIGKGEELGGGEFPDPGTPPRDPAPGG
jgi:hypothetical protein